MAGLGYKLFAAGEVLTAANLQGYAVDQSVMVFATSAERTTALPAPSQGMLSFLNDSGTTWQYFELYNVSTNPGGAKTAGWYPVGGEAIFFATATRSFASGTSYSAGASGFSYTELTDTLAWHDASTNPERIIPKTEGLYRATVSLQYAANGTGNRFGQLRKNGSSLVMYQGAGINIRDFSMTGVSYMNGSTDYFSVDSMTQDSGTSLTVNVQVMVEYVRPSIV